MRKFIFSVLYGLGIALISVVAYIFFMKNYGSSHDGCIGAGCLPPWLLLVPVIFLFVTIFATIIVYKILKKRGTELQNK